MSNYRGLNQSLRLEELIEVWDRNLFHVGLNAADEERVGHTQSGHERVEGVLRRQKIKNNKP